MGAEILQSEERFERLLGSRGARCEVNLSPRPLALRPTEPE